MSINELHKSNIKDVYRLSSMQEGIYYHAINDPASTAYFSQTCYRFYGSLEPSLVEQTIQTIFNRHDILRSVFNHRKAEDLIQIVLKERTPVFHYEDISSRPDREVYIIDSRAAARHLPFNLERDVLVRVAIYKLEENVYEFIWSHHHILMDGWCLGILIGEFSEIYESLRLQSASRLQPAAQYGEFIKWLQQQDKEKARLYWQNYLEGFREQTAIPAVRHITESGYRDIVTLIKTEDSDAIRHLCASQEVTLNTLLQTLWGIILMSYTQTRDVVFGSVQSLRPPEIAGADHMIGLMINTLPVRIRVKKEQSFTALLKEQQEHALDSNAYGYFPLAELQAGTELRQLLLDHIFIMENFPLQQQLEGIGKATENSMTASLVSGFSQTNYNLNIVVIPGHEIEIKFNYNAAVYDHQYIAQVSAHFNYLLQQVLHNPAIPVGKLKIISPEEEQLLISMGTGQDSDYTGTTDTRIIWNSDAIAVLAGDISLTYLQLQYQVDALLSQLQQQGVKRGDHVAVLTGRNIEMVISLLAINKAGAVYVPLDPAHPVGRLQFVTSDIGAVCLVSSHHLLQLTGFFKGVVIPVEIITNKLSLSDISSCSVAGDPAYMIYTSGTTGEPKGVPVRHESILSRVLYHNDYLNIGHDDVIMQFAAVGFDASVLEVLMALIAGAKLVIVPDDVKLNVALFGEWINEMGITAGIFPPAYLKIMDRQSMPALRTMISTGEAASVEDLLYYSETKQVYNGYGPTETCIGATFHQVLPSEGDKYRLLRQIPVGRPFADTLILLLDTEGNLLPQGLTGEICIGGVGLTNGYHHRPELTEQLFINYTTANGRPIRLYRSGDLGRWSENFELEYAGRKDEQLQLNGIRVEPGEIVYHLGQYENVREAAVHFFDDDNDRKVVGYIVTVNDIQLSEKDIFDYLYARIPAYMVPAHILQLKHLPLTRNGKVDKQRLPLPVKKEIISSAVMPLQRPAELLLAAAFERVLGKSGISGDADFFKLGGDSIKAIQIASKLYRDGYKLDVKDVFRFPVLSSLAEQVTTLTKVADQGIVYGTIPFTPVQDRFFKLGLQHPHHFNQSVLLHIEKPFSQQVLASFIAQLQSHHDALRMVFNPEQFNNNSTHPVYIEEKSIDSAAELEVTVQALQRSFNLSTGPLFKAGLYHLADGDRLLLVAHHLIMDTVSWRILLEDLGYLYTCYETGQPATLPLKTDSYKLWSEALLAYRDSRFFKQSAEYWIAATQQSVPPIFNGNKGGETGFISFRLNSGETNNLLSAAHTAYNTEVSDLLLSALGKALSVTFGCDRRWIMLEGHGREDIGQELDITRTVGWFTALYPVLLPCNGNWEWDMQIRYTKEVLRSIPDHGIGFGILQQEEHKDIAGVAPQILFNYLGQFDADIANSGFSVAKESAGDSSSPGECLPYGLMIAGIVVEEQLRVSLRYDSDLVQQSYAEKLCSALEQSLQEVIAHCINRDDVTLSPADLQYQQIGIEKLDQLRYFYKEITDNEIADIYQLTPMQEGMLFHSLMGDADAYFFQLHYTIDGKVDRQLVEDSMNLLIRRHDALRTIFDYKHLHVPVQVVLQERKSRIAFREISHLTDSRKRAQYIQKFLEEDRRKGFDLGKGPLFRITLLQVSEELFTFVWSCHHILMDGWCMGILIAEFTEIYDSLLRQRPTVLQPVKPFRNYMDWLQQTDKATSSAFWIHYLDGYEFRAFLPKLNVNTSLGKKIPETYHFQFSEALSAGVNLLARQCQVTPNIIVQVLWGILLSRYNYTDDVVFGTVVSGRQAPVNGIDSMIGLFINTIPVRVRYEGSQTFASLVKEIQQEALEATSHHFVSLADIQAGTVLKQELFNHVLDFESYPVTGQLEELYKQERKNQWKIAEVGNYDQTSYDLFIVVSNHKKISFKFQYNNAIYQSKVIRDVASRLEFLAEQVVENKWTSLSSLHLLKPEEEQQVMSFSTGPVKAYPVQQDYVSLFEEKVLSFPDNIAVSDTAGYWNYRELSNYVTHSAQVLQQAYHIRKGDVVVVLLPRNKNYIATVLAIWKLGAIYLPLDPLQPAERLQFIIRDAGAKLLIHDQEQTTLPEGIKTLHINEAATANNYPAYIPACVTGQDLAYIIYTSGSTGNPKGVMIAHAGMINHIYAKLDDLHILPGTQVAQMASQAFDISVWQMFAGLLAGATIRIYSPVEVLEITGIAQSWKEEKINVLQVVPSYLSELLSVLETYHASLELPDLSCIISTGEELPVQLAKRCMQRLPAITLVNAYGPTEASDDITHGLFSTIADEVSMPIGKPISNLHVYVADRYNQLCPPGVMGDILVSGIGVGPGYVGLPEKTAAYFMNDPYSAGRRLYRTGDIGCWTDEGVLMFYGRRDRQVKIKGHRVELGEVERVIYESDGVTNAVVIYRMQEEEDQLMAYVTGTVNTELLKHYLKKRLPDYMQPAFIIKIDMLPLTINGKIDRQRLPQPETTIHVYESMQSDNAAEQTLIKVWKEVLNRQHISLSANFFELGGDSLKAIRIIIRLFQLGYRLEVRQIFQYPVIAELSKQMELTSLTEVTVIQQQENNENDLLPEEEELNRINSLLN